FAIQVVQIELIIGRIFGSSAVVISDARYRHDVTEIFEALSDRALMEHAIGFARQSVSEPDRVSPKVGAVVVRDGVLLGSAFRGELGLGEHAEFTLLERKLGGETL